MMKTYSKTPLKIKTESTLIIEGLLLNEPIFKEHTDEHVVCRSRSYDLRHEDRKHFVYETQYFKDEVLGMFKIDIPRFEITLSNNKIKTLQL